MKLKTSFFFMSIQTDTNLLFLHAYKKYFSVKNFGHAIPVLNNDNTDAWFILYFLNFLESCLHKVTKIITVLTCKIRGLNIREDIAPAV